MGYIFDFFKILNNNNNTHIERLEWYVYIYN